MFPAPPVKIYYHIEYSNTTPVPNNIIIHDHTGNTRMPNNSSNKFLKKEGVQGYTVNYALPYWNEPVAVWSDFKTSGKIVEEQDNRFKIIIEVVSRTLVNHLAEDVCKVSLINYGLIPLSMKKEQFIYNIRYTCPFQYTNIVIKTNNNTLWSLDVDEKTGLNWINYRPGILWEVSTDGGYIHYFKRNGLYIAIPETLDNFVGFNKQKNKFSGFLIRSVGLHNSNTWCLVDYEGKFVSYSPIQDKFYRVSDNVGEFEEFGLSES
jgi:hypothetical protein